MIVDRDLPAGGVGNADGAPTITRRPAWQFDSALGHRTLCKQLRVASLAAFGADELPARTPPPARCSPTPSTRRAARSPTSIA